MGEYSKLTQKEYRTEHDWVDGVILLELCKKRKFNHMNKWYMHKLESILKNEMDEVFR